MNIDELREQLRDARAASYTAQKLESDLEQQVWLAEIELGLRPRPQAAISFVESDKLIRTSNKLIRRIITTESDTVEELD